MRQSLLLLSTLTLVACDIPTSAPILQSRWVVPSQSTRIAVGTLLPNTVSIAPDSSGFLISVSSATVTRTLSQDCGACAAANGVVVPKPAFVANASTSTPLPSEIAAAVLTSGTLQLTITHNYPFDPIRPSATARGYFVVTVTNGSTIIGKDSTNGAQTALPPNTPYLKGIPLSGNINGSFPVTVSVVLNSPAGDAVLMNSSRTFTATGAPINLKVATASVSVVNRPVTSTTNIDLSDIDESIVKKVLGGSLILSISNPFTVAGTLNVSLTTNTSAVIKSVTLVAGASTRTVDFTLSEIQTLLGHQVTLTLSGPVSASGPVTVSPKQAVVVATRLDLNLEVGR